MRTTPSPLLLLAFIAIFPGNLHAESSPPLQVALSAFASWDADLDGTLTPAELDTAIASPATQGENAAAAVALLRISRIKSQTVKDFTRSSLSELAPSLRFEDPRDAEETTAQAVPDPRSNFERYYAAALKKITTSPRALFTGPPSLENFRQGRLGTCFSLAPLTALTYADPEAVPRLFTVSTDDGAVTVTFGQDNTVTVAPLTDGEIALGTDTGGNGLWAATYEKAVGELRRTSANTTNSTPYAVATRGGSAGTMLSVLTGRAIERFSCKAWLPAANTPEPELAKKLDELRALLRVATAEKRLMTAGTSNKTRKVPSLSQNHAYAVLGYDATTDLITIRDPHGQNFAPKDEPGLEHGYLVRAGIFQVPVPEAVYLLSGFAFQQTETLSLRGYPRSAPATGPAL